MRNDAPWRRINAAADLFLRAEEWLTAAENAESAKRLRQLLRMSTKHRIEALADANVNLIEEHRQRLAESLSTLQHSQKVIPETRANWFVRWRSRMHYLPGWWMRPGIGVTALAVGLCLAYWQTPEQWVGVNENAPVKGLWAAQDGSVIPYDLEQASGYPLVRREGKNDVLRMWAGKHGYAEAQFPSADLHPILTGK